MEMTITLPENINANLGENLDIKGPNATVSRSFTHPRVKLAVENNIIKIATDSKLRADKAVAGAWRAHIKNMIKGAEKDYEYKLKIIYTHFPMTMKEDNGYITITNFMGEKGIRKAKILEGVKVKLQKEDITLTGADREKIGQTAANLEKSCVQRTKDKRIYQDGIYITQKG